MLRQFKMIPVFLAVLLLPVFAPATVHADSLWSDSGPASSLFGDHKARQVGDTITIVISENTSAVRTGSSNNSKSGSNNISAGTGIFGWLASASADSSDSFKSAGNISNSNKVTGRITAVVTAVKPNGDLDISGTQSINQNGEEQKIIVTGTVRSDDVAPDNTVLSSSIANAKLRIDGHGPLSSKQRQGILTQIFNILF